MPIPCPPKELPDKEKILYFRNALKEWGRDGVSTALTEGRQTHVSDLSGEELQRMADQKKESDQNIDEEVLGKDGAKKYKSLLRRENSMDTKIADAAMAEREKMEGGLTQEQLNRLHGIGDQGMSHESLSDIADVVQRVENAHDPSDIVQALKFQIPHLDKGPETQAGVKALASFKAAARTIRENGWDSKQIQGDLMHDFAARFSDPADAADMLRWAFPYLEQSERRKIERPEAKRLSTAQEMPPATPEPEKPIIAPQLPANDSGAFGDFLRNETSGRYSDADYQKAAQFHETGDKALLQDFSGLKQGIIERASTNFKAKSPEEAQRILEEEAKKASGKTITTDRGTTYKPEPGYSATEGQGDGITDLVEEKEDPETGLKTVFSVANPSQEKPEPTEKNPFLYRLHDLVSTLPNGRQQFGGATMDKDGTISRQTWDSKTSNVPKAERGLYESLVPQAFKGDRVDVKMLDDQLKNLPAVEVHTYGMEGKADPYKLAMDQITHEWLDVLPPEKAQQFESAATRISGQMFTDGNGGPFDSGENHDRYSQGILDILANHSNWTANDLRKAMEYFKAQKEYDNSEPSSGPRATQYYKSISPFDTEKYPVQRIDVVLPQRGKMSRSEQLKAWQQREGFSDEEMEGHLEEFPEQKGVNALWAPDNLHENLPNTLGWVMAQYVPHPVTGEKTMFIGELQSRWGQKGSKEGFKKGLPSSRNFADFAKEHGITSKEEVDRLWNVRENGEHSDPLVKEWETEWQDRLAEDRRAPDHPMIRNWESLALKAAVDTARREGAKSIILSDAESAMMTEGHDKQVTIPGAGFPVSPEEARAAGHDPSTLKTPQEGGMRAQYDKRGPDILRKLTGDTGKEVDMGVHKNAVDIKDLERLRQNYPGTSSVEEAARKMGKGSPVFKDEAGNPRTNAKGREYDLSKPSENVNRYGVGEHGKAQTEMTQKAVSDFEKQNPWIKGKITVHPNKESLRTLIKEGGEQASNSAQDALELLDKGSPVAGWMAKDGSIHLYPQNAPNSPEGIQRLIAHEVFHRGEDYAKIYAPKEYNRLQNLKSQLDDQHLAELGDGKYSPIYGDWRTNEESRKGLQTEWITDQIEKGALEKAGPETVLGKIWQALKDIYSRLTGNKTPTDTQIKDMYRAMTKVQESGRPHPKSPFGEGETKFSDFQASMGKKAAGYAEQVGDNLSKAGEDVKDAARETIDTFKSVSKLARELPKYTEAKKSVGTMLKDLRVDGARAMGRIKTLIEQIPSASRRAAITVFRQADGDSQTLRKWASDTKGVNAKFSKAATDALSLSSQERNVADLISSWYEARGVDAVNAGHLPEDVMKEGSNTYANGVWKKKILGSARENYNQFIGKLQRSFNFGKKASFENFYEGVMQGFDPKTLDAAHLFNLYDNHLSKVIRSNELIKNLVSTKAQDGNPMAVIKGVDVTGDTNRGKYKIIDSTLAKSISDLNDKVPYKSSQDPRLWGWKFMGQDSAGKDVMMKGNLAFHPEAFKIVDNMLRRSALKDWAESPSESAVAEMAKRGFSVVDSLNSGVKAGMFGFSPFHMVQEGTQALGHRFNPLTDLKDFNPDNQTHLDFVQHGGVLPGMEGQDNDMFEGLTSAGWMNKIPVAGPIAKAISDSTWKYVRSLKLKGYEVALEANKKTFADDLSKGKVSLSDVKHLTATQMNESFGGLNYQMMGRNPTVQHIMRLSLLAPDFLEARFRASASALQGLTGGKGGREQAMALGTLAVGSFVIARVLNGILNNGDTKPDHPFSVISGNREYTMRSLPEDIYKLITNPRQFALGRVSPLTARTAIETLTGRNYRGESIPVSEAMKNAALAGIPMSFRELPGLRQLTETNANSPISPLEGALSSLGIHISKFSPIVQGYELASQFKKQIGKPDTGAYPVSPYTPLKNALEDVDMDRAQQELQKLKQSMPKDKLARAVHASIFHSWMDNADEEKHFLKSLTPENKAVLKAAETRRRDLWRRFVKISGSGHDLHAGTPVPK